MSVNQGGSSVPSDEQLEKERQCLELKRAGLPFDEIAARVGYSNRGSAYRAYQRAMARTLQQPAAEIRQLEADRLDRLQVALWTKAMKGDGWAVDRVLSIMERRARLLGLDHADGLAERQQRLDELQAALVVRALTGILDDLQLTPEQRLLVGQVVPARLRAIAAADVVLEDEDPAGDAGGDVVEGEVL